MKINKILAVILLILTGLISSYAQPAAVQQLQNFQLSQQQQTLLPALRAGTNAPELYQGENLDVGPQRILRLNPRPIYFDVFLDSQIFFTDNATFAQRPNEIGSVVYVNTVQAAFTPPPMTLGSGKFAPSLGFASQWYNYDNPQVSGLDFDAQTVFLNGKYNFGKWQIGGGLNYTRLLSQPDYAQSYSEWMPTLGVQRVFPVGENMIFAIGDQIDYHFTQVPAYGVSNAIKDINNRFDNDINLIFSWQIAHKLILQPFYRLEYSNYPKDTLYGILDHSDRNDFLHTVGFTAAFYFNQNVSLRTFFSYSYKQSDDPNTQQYHEYDGGGGISLEFKF